MNVLSHAVRKAIVDNLEGAIADDGVKAAVIADAGRHFQRAPISQAVR
jgi:enoyl-CoA hydratase/carnithine racemase